MSAVVIGLFSKMMLKKKILEIRRIVKYNPINLLDMYNNGYSMFLG
jgi:hypothetical protein